MRKSMAITTNTKKIWKNSNSESVHYKTKRTNNKSNTLQLNGTTTL